MQPPALAPLPPRSVVVIDDHDIIRVALETLIRTTPDLRLVGSASTLAEALRMIESTRPDLVISDMGLRDSSGLDTVRAIVEAQGERAVLVVSAHDEMLYGEQVITLGAKGYLMKEVAHANVIPAAQAILGGGTWVSPRLGSSLLNRMVKGYAGGRSRGGIFMVLSARELQVLELLKSGKSTKEIAATMGLSVRTVDIYRARIKSKLGLRTGAQLIAYASGQC